jgi:glycerol-3-phosphate dehydrogenase
LNSFSAIQRPDIIRKITGSEFDLLVIGGGITGAGIALDATARGLKVVLADMQDFAGGTSSRSTKLIHGGLRYLKQLEFKLVAEVGKEREIIHKNAPHLTRPEKMLLPIVKNGSFNKFSARLGMWVYEWLAGVKKEEWHQVLNAEETKRAEPLLIKENLSGGILYYEYRTDDARLTLEIIKEAVKRGTQAINYMKAVEFIYKNEKICGAKLRDELNGKLYEVYAGCVVNATGPWVDELDDLEKKHDTHKLHITKGVHLVINKKKLPVKQAVYFDTHDRRMIFVIPKGEKAYIGTTDTFYEGSLSNPGITPEDKSYLLKCVNNYFSCNLTSGDIESGWAGLRPLVNKKGKGPSEISRKDEVFISESGMIIIAGGKLTGYRKMAERVVNKVVEKITNERPEKFLPCTTDKTILSGGGTETAANFSEFEKLKMSRGLTLGLRQEEIKELIYRYGSNIEELYTIIESFLKSVPGSNEKDIPVLLKAQIIYAIEKEMCQTPSDFFIRRTGMLYFDIETVKRWGAEASLLMQKILNSEDKLKDRFDAELKKSIEEVK